MKRFLTIILATLACLTAGAQTLQQGRDYFAKGNYVKAKPIMLKYLKQKPDDASRNYWYGVCCMETGEEETAIPYLEKAAEKKIWKAYRVLGQYYQKTDNFPNAISDYENYVKGISDDKELHDPAVEKEFTDRADSLKMVYRMLRNTSRVCFIDSFIVRKDELLYSYTISESAGTMFRYADFFEDSDDVEGEVFLPEMQNQVYFSRIGPDSLFRLYTRYRSGDNWIDETKLKGLESDGDMRYPFMLNDGQTIYYAASGSESLGGLDIFVSRYNTSTGRFLKPENIGMPFNSTGNDYLYMIDEANSLGYFATDRRQPQDTVCVYVFIPTDRTQKYVYEDDPTATGRAAQLISIDETQVDLTQVRDARQRLTLLRFGIVEEFEKRKSFTFIIDDLTIYHEKSDFKSADALKLFERWTELKSEYEYDAVRLDKMRQEFLDAGRQERENMRDQILQFEDRVLKAERQVIAMENDVRTAEINFLNR